MLCGWCGGNHDSGACLPRKKATNDELKVCPCCGRYAVLIMESKHQVKQLGKKVQFSRVICSGNKKHNYSLKTIASIYPTAIEHWNRRE